MQFAIIGAGAIGRYVHTALVDRGHHVGAIVRRPSSLSDNRGDTDDVLQISHISDLPEGIDHVIDCAGHAALRSHGPTVLREGIDLTTVSIGALADDTLYMALEEAAAHGNSRLHLASGAIGALDALRAAAVGGLQEVTYVGRKPPAGWAGSPAEERLDLKKPGDTATTHFEGSARTAATEYPKNANVAAAVALSGIGFDKTCVQLIADPTISANIHEVHAAGAFGDFSFEIRGNSLPDNPKSSALAAMSCISALESETRAIHF